jgi:hypothetical protein
MNFLPPIPAEPQKRQVFINIWQNEVRTFRKRPSFIIGMSMAVISSMVLLALTDGLLGRLSILLGVFGVACVYDTVTRHFCGALCERVSTTTSGEAKS